MLTKAEHDLQRTAPERQGVTSSAVLKFVETLASQIHEVHSFMLLRHGSVIAEGWWSPYRPEYPHLLFSLSKSFTSTAVGLAVAEGYFSIDDPVLSFFPDETPDQVNEHLAAMQVRHLLSMSTGQADDTWAYMDGRAKGGWIKGFFEVPVLHAPGTYFLYNTGATYMLSAIVQKTTGMKMVDYLETRLFAPLAIEGATWEESPEGINLGGIGLSLKTQDIAKFGQLYLQKGMWQGRQLLSEAWVTEATAFHMSNGSSAESDWTQGYGYQFWHCRHNAYRGDGVFGQYCVVMPEQDAVLAITGGMGLEDMQQPLDFVWDILLPAMGDETLTEDSAAHEQLTEKVSNLSVPLVQGESASPLVPQISGRAYSVDANERNIETISLDFSGSVWMVTVKTTSGEESFPCGYGAWQHGQTSLFNEPGWIDPEPVLACGAWTSAESFTMVVRLYGTPFFYTLLYHFVGDEMLLEMQVNVSFYAEKTLLTAKLA
jgi:CubicO group peptidase (beta-lactamase class C family)